MLNHPGHAILTSWVFVKFLPVEGVIEKKNSENIDGIFKTWQIDDDMGNSQGLHFLRQLLLKITPDLKNFPGSDFWLKKLKNDIKTALKLTGIEL